MNDYDVVAKISIVPRGPAGGVTIFMPSEERLNSGLYSKVRDATDAMRMPCGAHGREKLLMIHSNFMIICT
jgi:ATP-dependent Zn protease